MHTCELRIEFVPRRILTMLYLLTNAISYCSVEPHLVLIKTAMLNFINITLHPDVRIIQTSLNVRSCDEQSSSVLQLHGFVMSNVNISLSRERERTTPYKRQSFYSAPFSKQPARFLFNDQVFPRKSTQ